jgi:hypothetical protein
MSPVEVSISDANIITVYQAQQGRKYCSSQIQKYESEILPILLVWIGLK